MVDAFMGNQRRPGALAAAGDDIADPGCRPASDRIWATSRAVSGVVSAGFATTEQPAASAGATLRAKVEIG